MSIDNGIYILQTMAKPSSNGEIYEYRVAYAHDIDKIYGPFDDKTLHWSGDTNEMVQIFNTSPIFTDQKDAWEYAFSLSKEHEYLEYGVGLIPDFKDKITLYTKGNVYAKESQTN